MDPSTPPRPGGNVQRWWRVFGCVTVAACLIFVGTAGYEVFQVFHPESCSSMGDELAPGLTKLPELQLHPPHATPQGTPTWDCDPDHDVEDWYVAQRFETADDPIETSAYYRRALSSAGWIAVKALSPGEGAPGDDHLFDGPDGYVCFTRHIGTTTTYVSLDYLSDRGRGPTTYDVSARKNSYTGPGCGLW